MFIVTDEDWVEQVRAHPYIKTTTDTVEPCPTCGTECYVITKTEQHGRMGGSSSTHLPLRRPK